MTSQKIIRGREANTPEQVPARGWRDILLRVKDEVSNDNLSIVAAGVAFFGMLAIFPALATLVSIYGLAADPVSLEGQISILQGVLPKEVYDLIGQQLQKMAGKSSGALSAGALIGLLITLWSAGKGMKALITAFNIAYNEDEGRGFFKLNAMALLLTLAAILFIIVTLGLIAALPVLLGSLSLPESLRIILSWGRWPLLAILLMIGLSMLYRYAPHRDKPRLRWVSWGSVAATMLWLAGSALFSLYVSHFGSYNKTYGSLAAIVILLMWLYITAYAILLGAELNAESERQTRKDTTRGKPKFMGKRDAYAADTLGQSP